MIVYHGSIQTVDKPDVLHTERTLDFGAGFYVTTVEEQAIRWAKRKQDMLSSGKPTVNVYEYASTDGLIIKEFSEDLSRWIDFVCDCRDGGEEYKNYDIIKGKVANDKVYRVVNMYHRGIWDKARAIEEMEVYETYDQIAFITQKSIDQVLQYVESYEVK